jgi:hypothetical protein
MNLLQHALISIFGGLVGAAISTGLLFLGLALYDALQPKEDAE